MQHESPHPALTRARLAALGSMGRHAQALNLSRAAGLPCDQAIALVRLEQVEAAVTFAREHLTTPGDTLRLARILTAAEHPGPALDLAVRGLSLPATGDDRAELAHWLRETARALGRREIMLLAAGAVFEETLSREDFRAAAILAGPDDWPRQRESLLAILLAAPHAPDRIDILLDEGRIAAAVACIDPHAAYLPYYEEASMLRLAGLACAKHPDWVIALALREADAIIGEVQAAQYPRAAAWLALAGRAYGVSGRSGDWASYLEGLITTHRRKSSLRPLLEALRPTGA